MPTGGWRLPVYGDGKYVTVEASTSATKGLYSGSTAGDADGDTVVTGPAKSGTGNYSSDPTTGANDIFVKNSNHEWIDGDNREGRSFFLKNASSRIGLAKLREKAITTAQAWAADTGYDADNLVEHDGRYWLALSSSYNNSPDATDSRDWFDLGPTQ